MTFCFHFIIFQAVKKPGGSVEFLMGIKFLVKYRGLNKLDL